MAKRKRSLYESAPCKRLKISAKDTSGLESEGNIKMSLGEVQDMVKQEAFALFKQFDTKFEELNERIKRVECSPKHEMLVTKLQAHIFKIKRRLQEALISVNKVARPVKPKISSVIVLDENVPEASTSQPSLPQPQQSSTAGTLARSLGSSSSPSSATVRSAQVSLCQKTDGPDCILASSVPEVVRVASPCRKETSILGIPSARLSVAVESLQSNTASAKEVDAGFTSFNSNVSEISCPNTHLPKSFLQVLVRNCSHTEKDRASTWQSTAKSINVQELSLVDASLKSATNEESVNPLLANMQKSSSSARDLRLAMTETVSKITFSCPQLQGLTNVGVSYVAHPLQPASENRERSFHPVLSTSRIKLLRCLQKEHRSQNVASDTDPNTKNQTLPIASKVLEKEVVCAQSSGNGPEENAGLNRQACVSDVEKMIDLTTDDNDDQLGGLQPAAVNESSVSVARVNLTLRLPAKDPVSPSRTLPPLPETAVPLDLPAVAASFNMPQKPELKVAKIENPKAVGILWDLSQVDTSVASIQSYCLYVLHENANVRKLRWRSMGVIKAIQLPMCCRLTKLNPGRYHFAVVGKDIYGRYGPYSDIQSTTVSAVDC